MIKYLRDLWTFPTQGRIFISYRRDDAQWTAGRLADSLGRYFGDKRVFRDIEGIRGGADFGDVIHQTLGKADAVIVLIGDKWLHATNDAGRPRLHEPGDWVAQEIAAALQADIPVYPVLIEETRMPAASELPEQLRALARRNALTVSDGRWDHDVTRLARVIGLDIPSATERRLQAANLLISAGLALSVIATCAILLHNLVCDIHVDNPLSENWGWICPDNAGDSAAGCETGGPLSLAVSGVTFLAIVPASALLFVFARQVEATRRPFFLAAAWTGAIGTLFWFILLKEIDLAYEPVSMWFGGTSTALLMFALMNLSGFRPK